MESDDIRKKLCDVAERCFRDTADQDYIMARLAFRAKLFQQFWWCSQQAIEKYLKCILLLNRVPAKHVRHDISVSLRLIEDNIVPLDMTEIARAFIARADEIGRYRYLDVSWYIMGKELLELDMAIWEVRRYCRLWPSADLRDAVIKQTRADPPIHVRLFSGLLESIIDDRKHPTRQPLIWQNCQFGQRTRKHLAWKRGFAGSNSPFWLYPQIVDSAHDFIHIPQELATAYKEYHREINAKKTRRGGGRV